MILRQWVVGTGPKTTNALTLSATQQSEDSLSAVICQNRKTVIYAWAHCASKESKPRAMRAVQILLLYRSGTLSE